MKEENQPKLNMHEKIMRKSIPWQVNFKSIASIKKQREK